MSYLKQDLNCLLSLAGVASIMLVGDMFIRSQDSVFVRVMIQLLTK